MVHPLHLAMVATSICDLCCTARLGGPRRPTALIAGMAMLAAMADLTVGPILLSPPSWAVLLILVAWLTTVVELRRHPDRRWMTLHRGLGTVAVAVLLLLAEPPTLIMRSGSGHHPAIEMTMTSTAGIVMPHHSTMGVSIGGMVIAAAYAAVSGWLLARHLRSVERPPSRLVALDMLSMSACVGLMALG